MNVNKILDLDWVVYDSLKLLNNEDRHIFCSERPWELEYLEKIILLHYPEYSSGAIRTAIRQARRSMKPPRARNEFVNSVMCSLSKSR